MSTLQLPSLENVDRIGVLSFPNKCVSQYETFLIFLSDILLSRIKASYIFMQTKISGHAFAEI